MLDKEASSAAVVTKLESLSKVMAAVKPAVMAKAVAKIEKVDKEVLAKFKDADLTPEQVMMKLMTTKAMVVMMMIIMLFAMVMYNHDDYIIALMVTVLDVISYLIVTNYSFWSNVNELAPLENSCYNALHLLSGSFIRESFLERQQGKLHFASF